MTAAPMAFLLVKFNGSNDEPIDRATAQERFTAVRRGTMNVVDWFDDNTHGNVDMSDNEVFGWLELNDSVDDYNTNRANGTYSRWSIIDLGRAAAAAAGIDLSPFVAVVVVTNVEVDLFGGTGGVCCTASTVGKQFWEIQTAPSVLCQEMIHGLGIYNHTRRHGSDADYRDPYDVMSMFNAMPGHHPNDFDLPVGPGTNAAFMQRCGWLDPTRSAPTGQAVLRPLHRRDLAGPLYSVVDKYYVEYRASQRWDTGFSSIVLVHYIANDTSYLVAELGVGQEFTWGNPLLIFEPHGSIKVDAIDDGAETATITTAYSPGFAVPVAGGGISIFQTEFADGFGLVILNGKIIRIPPRSPEMQLIESAAALASLNEIQIAPVLKTSARAEIYAKTLAEVSEAHEHITGGSSPFDHMTHEEAQRFHSKETAELPSPEHSHT